MPNITPYFTYLRGCDHFKLFLDIQVCNIDLYGVIQTK